MPCKKQLTYARVYFRHAHDNGVEEAEDVLVSRSGFKKNDVTLGKGFPRALLLRNEINIKYSFDLFQHNACGNGMCGE